MKIEYSTADLVAEFVYAGKTLEEVAGYDNAQMTHVLCRPRSKDGSLIRKDGSLPNGVYVDEEGMRIIPKGKKSSYSKMFKQVMRRKGRNDFETKEAWESFLIANPKFGRGGEIE